MKITGTFPDEISYDISPFRTGLIQYLENG